MFAAARSEFGPVDVLVNNAGVFAFEPLEAISEEQFHRHYASNVLAMFLTAQALVAQPDLQGASMVNLTSVGISFSAPNASLYGSTKWAVAGLTKNLAVELAPRGIRVNGIAAGFVDTKGTRAAGTAGGELEPAIVSAIPLGRIGQPEDVAPTAAFLASDDARFITGEIVFVSGGQF